MIGARELFKPMMIGWVTVAGGMGVLVTLIFIAGAANELAGCSFFGVTPFPDGMQPVRHPVWPSIVIGLCIVIAGCLQGLVNWLIVSVGLTVVRLVRRKREQCQQRRPECLLKRNKKMN